MSPLKLGDPAHEVPKDYARLLELLSSRPQPAVVHYATDGTRVELSGRVLSNWTTKLIGLFAEEHDLGTGQLAHVDMQPHWKTAAVLLAAATMGAEVRLTGPDTELAHPTADLVVTDRPTELIESAALGEAEVAAVSAGTLDASFAEATGEQLPAWVTDVSADVRQQPDQLLTPLPDVSLPVSMDTSVDGPLVLSAWNSLSFEQMLGTWAAGGVVVLFSGVPEGEVWELMRRNEGLT